MSIRSLLYLQRQKLLKDWVMQAEWEIFFICEDHGLSHRDKMLHK